MSLELLKASDFRCLESITLQPHENFTLIAGPNGAGKTSILEAVSCVCRGRSFRGTRTEGLVRHGQKFFELFAKIVDSDRVVQQGLRAGRGLSEIRVDGESRSSQAVLAEALAVHVIDPEIHRLISEGPDVRRQFVDYGVFHVEHQFLDSWRHYRRALKQRNTALRAHAPLAEIRAWDADLLRFGGQVDASRRSYVDSLNSVFSGHCGHLLGEAGQLSYRRGWTEDRDFAEALLASEPRDRDIGTTHVGPHRADVRIEFRDRMARQQVSRGQQKAMAAALVLGQTEILQQRREKRGLLLLDDPAAELDGQVLERVLRAVFDSGSQVIATCLQPDALQAAKPGAVFHVEQGQLQQTA